MHGVDALFGLGGLSHWYLTLHPPSSFLSGRHYSNEGEAMRRSKELLEQELAEEEDDDESSAMDGVEEGGEGSASAAAPTTNGLRLNGL